MARTIASGVLRSHNNQVSQLRNYWYPALQNAATQRATAIVIGDSVSEGYNATGSKDTNGYCGLLYSSLSALYGAGGRGYIPFSGGNNAWVNTGSWSILGYAPWGVDQFANGTANKKTITIYCDSFTLHYITLSTTAAIDGTIDGSPFSITSPTYVVTSASVEMHSATISCGSLGNHTIEILGNATVGKFTVLAGIQPNIGTGGVQIGNVAHSGRKAGEMGTTNKVKWLEDAQADLLILALTLNDYAAQTALATYEAQMRVILDKAVSVGSMDKVIILCPFREGAYGAITQAQYNAKCTALATEYGAFLVDFYTMWGSTGQEPYESYEGIGDGVHPNDAGHAAIANYLLTYLKL